MKILYLSSYKNQTNHKFIDTLLFDQVCILEILCFFINGFHMYRTSKILYKFLLYFNIDLNLYY